MNYIGFSTLELLLFNLLISFLLVPAQKIVEVTNVLRMEVLIESEMLLAC